MAPPLLPNITPYAHRPDATYEFLAADLQVSNLPKDWSGMEGNAGHAQGPSVRPSVSQASLRVYQRGYHRFWSMVPAEQRDRIVGVSLQGDIANRGFKGEVDDATAGLIQLVLNFPSAVVRSWLMGNHDLEFYLGVLNNSCARLGVAGLFMGANCFVSENYIDEVAAPAAGGRQNLTDKIYTEKQMQQLAGFDFEPVVILEANQENYQLQQGSFRWNDFKQVKQHFWREVLPGQWHAQVLLDPLGDGTSVQKDLHVSAVIDGPYETEAGSAYKLTLNLDTSDFLDDSTLDGAIDGLISYIQTNLVEALLVHIKQTHPRLVVTSNSHFGFDKLQQDWKLTSPTTWWREDNYFGQKVARHIHIAQTAHIHRYEYLDLNQEGVTQLDLTGRATPFPMIGNASMIDGKLGGWAVRTFGGKDIPGKENQVIVEYTKVTFDQQALSAELTPVAQQELEDIEPPLLPYVRAMKLNTNAQVRLLGFPSAYVDDGLKLRHYTDGSFGLSRYEGDAVDIVKAFDTLRLMVEVAQTEMQYAMANLRIALHDIGLGSHADELKQAFKASFDSLDAFYRAGLDQYQDPEREKAMARELNHQHNTRYVGELEKTKQALQAQLEVSASSLSRAQLLAKLTKLIDALQVMNARYTTWLEQFEIDLASKAPFEILNARANLTSSAAWNTARSLLRALPYDLNTTPFQVLLAQRSAQKRAWYQNRLGVDAVPDKITIAVDVTTGAITMDPPPAPATPEMIDEAKENFVPMPEVAELRDQTMTEVARMIPYDSSDLMLGLGPRFYLGQDHLAWQFNLGGRLEHLGRRLDWTRLEVDGNMSLIFNGAHGEQLQLSAAPLLNINGHITLGPRLAIGLPLQKSPTSEDIVLGLGASAKLLYGGALRIDVFHNRIKNNRIDPIFQVILDIPSWLRTFYAL